MTTTSLLLTDNWDIQLDAKGNIATTKDGYAIAQDVACAVSTFYRESVVNNQIGVDYNFDNGRGLSYLSFLFEQEAKRLPLVTDAKCVITFTSKERNARSLKVVLVVTDVNQNQITINL